MPTTLSGHLPAGSTRIVFGQFRQCGFMYAFRKFLVIALLQRLSAHLAVTHSLALPQTGELLAHHPKSAFKYLRKYLARSFDIHTRSLILANHYRYLNDRVRPDFIGRICRGKIMLWENEVDGHRYGIGLTYPKNEEGELFLVFSEDGAPIFTLSFTIAPGSAFDLPDEQVVFISRVQGAANSRENIKRATKAFEDIAPAALLLEAVRGIATSLDIPGILGVSAENQVCLGKRHRATATSVYDEFWTAADARKVGRLGYYLPTVAEEKPLSLVKNKYRSRVKRKRQFRSEFANQVSRAFNSQCAVPQYAVVPRTRTIPSAAESRTGNYCGTLPAMNALSFATSASITS